MTILAGYECFDTGDEQHSTIETNDLDDARIEAARILYDKYVRGQYFDADLFQSLVHWLKTDSDFFQYDAESTRYFVEIENAES